MDSDSLKEIKELAKNKACILVHFGNPLALKHFGDLSDFEAVICAYQRFEEVQKLVGELLL
jgi:accessory colonization factor AcfC